MDATDDTTRSDKSATDDGQTTRRTFLGAAAAVAGLSASSSTATAAVPDVEPTTDYLEEWYEWDEKQAARGQPVLPTRTPVPEHIGEYWGVDERHLMLVCMADRFLGDDPDDDLNMAVGISNGLHELAETVMRNAVDENIETKQ